MFICGGLAFLFQYYISLYIAKTGDFYNFGIEHEQLYVVFDALKEFKLGWNEKLLGLNMSPVDL